MIKRQIAVLTALGVAFVAFSTGCSEDTTTVENITESITETIEENSTIESESETEEATYDEVGQCLDSESEKFDEEIRNMFGATGYINISNKTGAKITEITLRSEDSTSDQPSFEIEKMLDGYVFENESTVKMRIPLSSPYTFIDGGYHKVDDKNYYFDKISMDIVIEDDMVYTIHDFYFCKNPSNSPEYILDISVYVEDGVAYLTYTDFDGNEVNTKEDELAYKESVGAEGETSEAAVQNDQVIIAHNDNGSVDVLDDDSGDDNADNVEATKEEVVQVTEAQIQQEENNDDADSGNGSDSGDDNAEDPNAGCIGNEGLFY